MKRYLLRYQISLPTCFYYCSTELQFLTVAGMLSRDALPMNIGAKYFEGNSWLLQKAPQAFSRKTHHIRQFGKGLWNAYNNYNRKGRLLFDVSAAFKYIIKCHPSSLPHLFCTF